MTRKTITVDEEVYDRLDAIKRGDESWSDALDRLTEAETHGRGSEHTLNALTVEHIDDIAARTARQVARELKTGRR